MARVMIVDDSLISRMSLRMILKENGHEVVHECTNGIEACDKYFILKPDLVTMDITMPVMDGLQALKHIMNQDSEAQIIMISALGQEPKILESLNHGAKNYITKPFEPEQIIEAINELFCFAE